MNSNNKHLNVSYLVFPLQGSMNLSPILLKNKIKVVISLPQWGFDYHAFDRRKLHGQPWA